MEPPAQPPAGPGLCGVLRGRTTAAWERLHRHPFLVELAEGRLPLERFRFFVAQDLVFLPAFARCAALGAAGSTDEATLRYFAAELAAVLDEEIPANRALLARLAAAGAGERPGETRAAPACRAYTDELLAVASGRDPLDVLVAMLPCSWSYLEIAERLAPRITAHPVYADWLRFYLTPSARDRVSRMLARTDDLAAGTALPPERVDRLVGLFERSLDHELTFWEMAYTGR